MPINEDTKKQMRTKGIKLHTISCIGAVIFVLLLTFAGYNLTRIVNNYKKLVNEFDLHLQSHDYIDALQNGSDDMTEQCRLFVMTQDPVHMEAYFDIVDDHIREDAKTECEDFFRRMGYADLTEQLDKALDESDDLMDYEIHAMKLMVLSISMEEDDMPDQVKAYQLPDQEITWSSEQKKESAVELVFGSEYCQNKEQIDSDISSATAAMSEELEDGIDDGIDHMWRSIIYLICLCVLLTVLFAVIFILLATLIIRPLRDYVKSVEKGELLTSTGAYELKYLASTYNKIFKVNQENKARMSFELEHDALTNVYSRLAFEEKKKELSEEKNPMALLIIDIDHFKNVNDTYGHDAGDEALKKIAATMNQLVRAEDFVARIGGDEFVVILKNVYSDNSAIVGKKIDRINEILQNPKDGSEKLSLSVGVAFSENGYSEELFKQADTALYQMKTVGRCGYRIYKNG